VQVGVGPIQADAVACVAGTGEKLSLGDQRGDVLIPGHAGGQRHMGALVFDMGDGGLGGGGGAPPPP
jgi:hypothetical protein